MPVLATKMLRLPADLKRIDKFSTSGTGISTQSLLQKGSARTGLKGRPWLVGVALLAGILLSSLWWWFKTPETILPVRKFQFSLSSILRNPWKRNAVISPDGSMIAFLESNRIWIRNLNELQPRELPGTKHADRLFWSPKSDFVAYLDTETPQFKKIAVAGGEPKTISDYQFAGGYGQDWGPDDNIVFAGSAEGLFRVSARGGQPELTIKSDTTKEVGIYAFPVYLPDGTLLATTYQPSAVWRVVKITESKATPITGIPHDYLVNLAYSPTGHLLYNNDGGLWAVPFSSSKLEVIGEPLLIDPDGMGASISTEGTLVYTKNVKSSARLIWVDRRGRLLGKIGQPQGRIENPSISPDGSRIAVAGFKAASPPKGAAGRPKKTSKP